jgi:hypothetical protein
MNKSEIIHKNTVDGRYGYLLLFVLLILINQIISFAKPIVVIVVAILMLIALFSNRKITPDNLGFVAILQVTSIVGTIGVYDYFFISHDRLKFLLNFICGFSCALSIYGLYYGFREKG